MKKSALGTIAALSLVILSFSEPAFAGQQATVRTGRNGRSFSTERTYGDGQQTTVRAGSNGNTQTTERTYGDGQQTTVRTGPNGSSQVTTRTSSNQ